MENQKTLVSRVNKELEELENDITALADWPETHHKNIENFSSFSNPSKNN